MALIRSPLSGWIGGKMQLSQAIVPLIPAHECYVEPFAGAAWIFFRKPESTVEVLNDLNRDIVTLYRVIQHHLEEFIRYFRWVLVSRDEFERWKRVAPDTLTDIQRSARFYYLQKLSFGGRIVKPTLGISTTNPPRLIVRVAMLIFWPDWHDLARLIRLWQLGESETAPLSMPSRRDLSARFSVRRR